MVGFVVQNEETAAGPEFSEQAFQGEADVFFGFDFLSGVGSVASFATSLVAGASSSVTLASSAATRSYAAANSSLWGAMAESYRNVVCVVHRSNTRKSSLTSL